MQIRTGPAATALEVPVSAQEACLRALLASLVPLQQCAAAVEGVWLLQSQPLSGHQCGCQKMGEILHCSSGFMAGSRELLHPVSAATRQRMRKPFLIHGIAEDAAYFKSCLLGTEHQMTCAEGGIHFEFRAVVCASVYSALSICEQTDLFWEWLGCSLLLLCAFRKPE